MSKYDKGCDVIAISETQLRYFDCINNTVSNSESIDNKCTKEGYINQGQINDKGMIPHYSTLRRQKLGQLE